MNDETNSFRLPPDTILVCTPVVDEPTPPMPSERDNCTNCGCDLWVSKDSQPISRFAEILCISCTVRRRRQDGPDDDADGHDGSSDAYALATAVESVAALTGESVADVRAELARLGVTVVEGHEEEAEGPTT